MRSFWFGCIVIGIFVLLFRYVNFQPSSSVGIGFITDEASPRTSSESLDATSPSEDQTSTALLEQAERLGFQRDAQNQAIILVSQQKRTAYVYLNGELKYSSEVRIPETIPHYADRVARLGPFNSCDGNYSRSECDIRPKFSGNRKIAGTAENVTLLGPIAISIEGSNSFLVHGVPDDQRLLNLLGDRTSGCVAFLDSRVLQETYKAISEATSAWLFYTTSG